ncbi:hypothetical protein BP6252_02410 [Coleophoma cylindrospora]|uniref:Uncharacterized protein n=1 Tax=Coleophoma cylindrospora TaxID=1849047 RepID=A0A3D8SEQ1_9HELO|nr:hypothetical protein BP6252_02410 [Coleophoma cylindrospora]
MAASKGEQSPNFIPLVLKTIALIGIYASYGLLQERIIKGTYENPSTGTVDKFHSPPLLVLCNRVVSFGAGLLLAGLFSFHYAGEEPSLPQNTPAASSSWLSRFWKSIKPASPLRSYAIVAGLNNVATLSQYASLSYLSFTTSTLAKSAKMVPVLIIGYTLYQKRYKPRQWIGALVVILGIWIYLTSLGENVKSKGGKASEKQEGMWGVIFVLAYLFFDGLTSSFQEKLFGHAKGKDSSEGGGRAVTLWGISRGVVDQMVSGPLPPIPESYRRELTFPGSTDFHQHLLHHDCVQHADAQPALDDAPLPHASPQQHHPPIPHLPPQSDSHRGTTAPIPCDLLTRRVNSGANHDDPPIRQYRVQRDGVWEPGGRADQRLGGRGLAGRRDLDQDGPAVG